MSNLWSADTVDMESEYLHREALMTKLQKKLIKNRIVLMSSPAGTGKSTMLQLLKEKYETEGVRCYRRPLRAHADLFGIFKQIGFDVSKMCVDAGSELDSGIVVVLLDDAQCTWLDDEIVQDEASALAQFVTQISISDNAKTAKESTGEQTKRNERPSARSHLEFWAQLVKEWRGLPKNLRVVISATRSLQFELHETPTDLNQLPSLTRVDFKLSESESYQLLDITAKRLCDELDAEPLGHIIGNDDQVRRMMVDQCGGIVAALTVSLNKLFADLGKASGTSRKNERSLVQQVVQCFTSSDMASLYCRCFPVSRKVPLAGEIKHLLAKCIMSNSVGYAELTRESLQVAVDSLDKRGVLVKSEGLLETCTYTFTAPVAERYMTKLIFPDRAQEMLPEGITAKELVLLTLKAMSTSALARSQVPRCTDPLIETVWQEHFYRALMKVTPSNVSVVPEISRVWATGEALLNAEGEGVHSNFWINSTYLFAIELLVGGRDRKKHVHQYEENGRYAQLGQKDYAVVDFRETQADGAGRVAGDVPDACITVFFKQGHYNTCYALSGKNKNVVTVALDA